MSFADAINTLSVASNQNPEKNIGSCSILLLQLSCPTVADIAVGDALLCLRSPSTVNCWFIHVSFLQSTRRSIMHGLAESVQLDQMAMRIYTVS